MTSCHWRKIMPREIELPWHVVCRTLPEDTGYPTPWSPVYPVRFGAEVLVAGVQASYTMRPLRNGPDGVDIRCTNHLLAAAPAELVRRHRTHLTIEFRNWALLARQETAE